MMPIRQGLLLPESTLTSTWFTILATVVAFNTIIYVGLTVSKFIPWPKQIHPSKVRALHDAVFNPARPGRARKQASLRAVMASDNPFELMRTELTLREVPQAFAAFGGLLVIVAAVQIFFLDRNAPVQHLFEMVIGLGFLVVAQVFGRRSFRAPILVWGWVIGFMILMAVLLIGVAIDSDILTIALAMVFLTAFGSITLRWPPVLIATSITIIGIAVVMFMVDSTLAVEIVFISLIASATGMLLQSIRLSSLHRLSEEKELYTALATTDPLTGLLTRSGLIGLLPGAVSNARRAGSGMCVMIIDIVDLRSMNASYGITYGDAVLRSVSDAIRSTVRVGDLVSRWSADDFLVTGAGTMPDADSIRLRIEEFVRNSGISLGKKRVEVNVSSAAGDPRTMTFEELVTKASGELA